MCGGAGYLFWSDWEQAAPRIERASLAGRRRRALVRVDVLAAGAGAWPNGISLDYRATRYRSTPPPLSELFISQTLGVQSTYRLAFRQGQLDSNGVNGLCDYY